MRNRLWLKLVDTTSTAINALLPHRAIEALVTVFGFWALVTPLLLWIAWSPAMLGFFLATGIAAVVLAGVFATALIPEGDGRDSRSSEKRQASTVPLISKKKRPRSWRGSA